MSRTRAGTHVIARDVFGIVTVLFIGLVVILMQAKLKEATDESKMPGSLAATISWPEGNDDVDLWLNGPAEPVPVGYSNKGGITWNLLRDDLGLQPDFLSLNFENAYSRGVPPGDYRINVQCYRCVNFPVEVSLEVVRIDTGGKTILAQSTITLRKPTEEKTGLAFRLDADGKLVPGSMNTLFEPLRAAKTK